MALKMKINNCAQHAINTLKEADLHYAYVEYFSVSDYWETTRGQRIITLPNEKQFYTVY